MVTEKELLIIVETLNEFYSILLSQRLNRYNDHKNLTYEYFNTHRVLILRLILKEYKPEIKYILDAKIKRHMHFRD